MKVTTLNYSQHLLVSQTNYTCQYFGDRIDGISGDKVERYLKTTKLKPRMIWDDSKREIIYSKNGCIIFDDTVIDHNSSREMELVRKQWSGNAKRVIRGIGLVGCLYYNPDLNQSWLIDYRLFDPENDGLKKTEHSMEMFQNIVYNKTEKESLIFQYTLFDAAYASKKFLALIDNLGHKYLCNIRNNRNCWEIGVDYTATKNKSIPIKDLNWNDSNQAKLVRLKDFPVGKNVRLFKITVSTDRTDYIITNDISITTPDSVKKVNGMRWNIESFHREIKQITGLEACQCRKNRSQRTHINCCLRVWLWLKQEAVKLKTTVYQLKQNQMDDYYTTTMKYGKLQYNLY